jgi:hypothetical protein
MSTVLPSPRPGCYRYDGIRIMVYRCRLVNVDCLFLVWPVMHVDIEYYYSSRLAAGMLHVNLWGVRLKLQAMGLSTSF